MSLQEFMDRFRFSRERAGLIGVERESFLTIRDTSIVVPRAKDALERLGSPARFTSELSACQIEERTSAVSREMLIGELLELQRKGDRALIDLGLQKNYWEVGPEDMLLDVYPDPRYLEIAQDMNPEVLRAACRTAATHVHVGMPDHETALRVYNWAVKNFRELCSMGDLSGGERLKLYRMVVPEADPVSFGTWADFYRAARSRGEEVVSDPRRFWTLIRISVHGTIEFRMAGSTDDVDRVNSWARDCHCLCLKYM